ncbi:hypothetical protein Nham_1983 [Nitrobacter hamburgensis X14]|jgi:hypothetical protein|uniref:Ribbon-helix-helix protein CopG domain-containing protein n=2 Tax=Nitrobacter hamburgensis TaxID=912 RepID=Q1QLW4_NITHX|nr:hypothetical protein Nham_1983 [Nitrobacter hamburgensis X14]
MINVNRNMCTYVDRWHGNYGHFDESFLKSTSCGDSSPAKFLSGKLGGQMSQAKKVGRKSKGASTDKRNFFATMSADVIKSLKRAALEDDITASEILEEATKDWLTRRAGERGAKGRG